MDLAGNEVASILVSADADISPVESKLTRMEQKLGDAASRIDRTYARAGSQAFTGLEQATNRVLQRIPLIGGVLAQVEGRASSLRQSFLTAGQSAETAMRGAARQVDAFAQKIAQTEARLQSLTSKLSSAQYRQSADRADFLQGLHVALPNANISGNFLRSVHAIKDDQERLLYITQQTGIYEAQAIQQIERASISYAKMGRAGRAAQSGIKEDIAATEKELAQLRGESAAAEKGLAGLASAGGGLSAALGEVAAPAVAAVAALVLLAAAMAGTVYAGYSLASAAAEAGAKYKDLSMEVNVSAHELSALDVIASQVGVNFNQIGSGLGIFEKKLESGAEKSSKLSRVLKDQGVDVRDNQKALEGMFTILSRLPEGETQTALAMEAFGKGGKAMLAIVKQAHGDLPTMIALLDRMGATLSDKDGAAAQEFEAKQKLLAAQFDVMKVKVGEELMPIFENLFDNLSKWLAQNQGELRAWGETFAAVAKGIISWAEQEINQFRLLLSVWGALQSQLSNSPYVPGNEAQIFDSSTGQFIPNPKYARADIERENGTPDLGKAMAEDNAQTHAWAEAQRKKEALARHLSGLMGEKSGGHKKGAGAANRVAEAALAAAQVDLREAESVYQQGTQIAKRFLEQNLSDYASYVATLRTLEEERYKAVQAGFKAEEDAASGLRGPKREEKLKDIHQRERAAEREHGERMAQITAENEQHAFDVKQRLAQQTVSLLEEMQRAQEQDLQRQIERGTTTNVAAMGARFTALAAVAEAQGKVLENALIKALGGDAAMNQLGPGFAEMISQTINDSVNATNSEGVEDAFKQILANASNKDAAQEAINNIRQFFLQRKAAFAQFNKDEHDAEAADLRSLQDYQKQLADLTDATSTAQRASQEALLKALEAAGMRKQALWRRQYQFDIEGEQLQSARRLRELQAERDAIAASEQNETRRLALLKAKDAEIEAERAASNVRQLQILDDLIQKQNDRLEKIADQAVSTLDNGLKALRTNGFKAMFQSIGNDFLDMIFKMEEDLLKSKLMTLLRQLTNTPLPGSGVAGAGAAQAAHASGGPFDLVGTILSKFFHIGGGGGSQTADASAVSNAGRQATTAIKDGWTNSVVQIGKTGDKQAGALMSVGQSIVSTMLSIASILAAGAGRGSFWKGLFAAAGIGFISGLTNGLFKPKGGSDGGDDGANDYNPDTSGSAATGGFFAARPGGRFIQVAEGGYDEVVLSTDPAQRPRMMSLLASYMQRVGASGGSFAQGGFTSGYVPPRYGSRAGASSGGGFTVGAINVTVASDGSAMSDRRARKTGRQIARASRLALAGY